MPPHSHSIGYFLLFFFSVSASDFSVSYGNRRGTPWTIHLRSLKQLLILPITLVCKVMTPSGTFSIASLSHS
ncbi:hypothetical protein SESBI_48125 [Sesbania bispinosa]|nr:hypothetical protein SESBI_48125 [Sesbania bispinosa]